MNTKTPVSVLEEYLVSKGHPRASYEFNGTGASHCPSFTCSVSAGGHSAEGKGTTKKDAKHDAAKNVLQLFEIQMNNNNNTELPNICMMPVKQKSEAIDPFINYVGMLNEKAAAARLALPQYEDCISTQNGQFVFKCHFNQMESSGCGSNKKYAKQQAAKEMFAKIQDVPFSVPQNEMPPKEIFVPSEKNTHEAISKYLLLMENLQILSNDDCIEELDDDIKTWDDLISALDQRKISHELGIFQRNPTIWSFKIRENVLLATGNDENHVKLKIMSKVRSMLKSGLSFTSMEY